MAEDDEEFQVVCRLPWGEALERKHGDLFDDASGYTSARRRLARVVYLPRLFPDPFGKRVGLETTAQQHADRLRQRLTEAGESEETVERYLDELRQSIAIHDQEMRQRMSCRFRG